MSDAQRRYSPSHRRYSFSVKRDGVLCAINSSPYPYGLQGGDHAWRSDLKRHVPVTIPSEGTDSVVKLHTKSIQGVGRLLSAAATIRLGTAVYLSFDCARSDFILRTEFERVIKDRGNQQGLFLHRAQHRFVLQ